jgi:hypothetical protein
MLSRSAKRKMRFAHHTGPCGPVMAWDYQNKRKRLPCAKHGHRRLPCSCASLLLWRPAAAGALRARKPQRTLRSVVPGSITQGMVMKGVLLVLPRRISAAVSLRFDVRAPFEGARDERKGPAAACGLIDGDGLCLCCADAHIRFSSETRFI